MTADGAAARPTYDAEAVRDEFPIFANAEAAGEPVTFLDSGASAQKPRSVISKEVEVYEQYYANAYRGVYRFGARVDEELEAAREAVRRLINAEDANEIAFSPGATASLNFAAFGWGRRRLQPGDEIVVNLLEHHANLVPWQQVAKETGAKLIYAGLTADGLLDLESLANCVGEKTRIVATTAMSNVFGSIVPLAEVGRIAHEAGAVFVVDGPQSVPHGRTDVRADEIDFLAFSGHKLYGPSGVGVFYGRRELLDETDPVLFGGHMIGEVGEQESTWAMPPAKFEAGTLPIAQAIGLGAAVEFVERIGLDAIAAHEHALLSAAWQALREVPGVNILGPPPGSADGSVQRGAILSFTLDGAAAEDVARLLDRQGIFVRHGHHCTMPLHDALNVSASTRASFAAYNRLSDVEALSEGLKYVRKRLRLE